MHDMQREGCVWGGVRALGPPPRRGGSKGGATAPPRGAVGAEPQAKNAKLPIKHAFSHRKRGLRAGWESHPKMYVGKARPWSEVEVRGLEVNLGATKRTCAQPFSWLTWLQLDHKQDLGVPLDPNTSQSVIHEWNVTNDWGHPLGSSSIGSGPAAPTERNVERTQASCSKGRHRLQDRHYSKS